MPFSKRTQQAEEVFALGKWKRAAPQLAAALRGGKRSPNQNTVRRETVPLVIWYGVPFPADPDRVVHGCEVWVHPVSEMGASC